MPVRACALLILTALLAAVPSSASAREVRTAAWARATYRPGEVVVRTTDGHTHLYRIHDGSTVLDAAARLAARPGIASATPNFIARASAFVPNDPGVSGQPSGWQELQWNFLAGPGGIDAPTAWENLNAAGHPGGSGVTIAVLDTGVAYRDHGKFRRSPDLAPERFRKGYDFVDNDAYPLDHNGHGTHVASTIAETADNGIGLVGLAYGARIMPVRVLDRLGEGDSIAIARGIRFAARSGAQVINHSFEISSTVTADQIPDILSALRYARHRGVLVIAASGNASASAVAYPARATQVLSVGAVTEHGCLAEYSNAGSGLDLVAPGGGPDADVGDPGCQPDAEPGRNIVQMTFDHSVRRFALSAATGAGPDAYMGTSMAAPHVSAIAAMIIASGVIGPLPTPKQVEDQLKATATDLGKPGPDSRYGYGLVNAARATTPAAPAPTPEPTPAPA
jgi:serine protease